MVFSVEVLCFIWRGGVFDVFFWFWFLICFFFWRVGGGGVFFDILFSLEIDFFVLDWNRSGF